MSADLDKLIAAVEAGDAEATGDALREIGKADMITLDQYGWAYNAFKGSLDAAKALHDALLPGWFPGLSQNIHSGHWYAWVQTADVKHFSATEPDPARAWLLAILRAYRGTLA